MIIDFEGRKTITYNDAVVVKRKNARVVLKKRFDGKAIYAQFVRIAYEKIKKKDLSSNQRLVKRMGMTMLITNITITNESLNDLVIALMYIDQIKNEK